MKIIIGLGNPGPEYARTRHNSGQLLVDRIFNSQFSIFNDNYGWRRRKAVFVAEFPNLVLVKTAGVFMNESGKMIYDLRFMNYDFQNLYVAHDDLDIKLGEYKVQFGKGPKIHNGVNSIEKALGTDQFWQIRIGIDNRNEETRASMGGQGYVLQRFAPGEKETVERVMTEISRQIIK